MKHLTPLLLLIGSFLIHPAGAQQITFDAWQKFTRPENMPAGVKLQRSKNNVDLVKFKGRYYVAFRTGPTHFASRKVRMYVVSSADLKTWDYECTINTHSDLRECRFAVLKDSLYLYCFQAGTRMFRFEPKKILATATNGTKGKWTDPASVGLDGFVPWRLRNKNDTLYLSAYYGKELYNSKHHADLRLLTSTNGRNFKPLSPEPQIDVKTAEEGEFIFDKKGDLYATVRLEGNGSIVCKAPKDSLYNWKGKRSKYKYDSALLFENKDNLYLISRRNLDGPMDRSVEAGEMPCPPDGSPFKGCTAQSTPYKKTHAATRLHNQLRYSLTQKRTALFAFDKNDLKLHFLLDFPSTGDCSYPALERLNDHDFLVLNYSSDYTKHPKNWIRGQLGTTDIYWTVLHMP